MAITSFRGAAVASPPVDGEASLIEALCSNKEGRGQCGTEEVRSGMTLWMITHTGHNMNASCRGSCKASQASGLPLTSDDHRVLIIPDMEDAIVSP